MNLRPRLVGLAANLLILGIIIALPATLLALGASPIPGHLPSLEQVRAALTSPDDGTLALAAINIIAWTAWAFLTGTLVLEVGARLAKITTPHVPGLGIPQTAARNLITAAALLFITTPLITAPATAAPDSTAAAPANTSTATSTGAHEARPTQAISQDGAVRDRPASQSVDRADTVETHTVKEGENLWSIAAARLGAGQRYRDLITVNPELRGHPNVLTPGTVLNLPTSGSRHRQHDVRVHRGETLSGIAHRELGDADRYPQIFKASTNIRQSDGRHLKDPDLVDIGWRLTIPATTPTVDEPPTPAPGAAPASPAPASPAPASPAPAPTAPSSPPRTTSVTPSTPATPNNPTTANASATVPTPAATDPAVTPSAQAPTPQATTPPADTLASQITAAPWVLAGLTGGGVVLAGSMLLVLRRRRQAQFRARRPGRSITATAPVLTPVEKTVLGVGSTSSPTVEFVDEALRRLATQCTSTGQGLPAVAAIELGTEVMILHLSQAAALPQPWTDASGEQLRWNLPVSTDPTEFGPRQDDQPAPYPLLVTIGAADDGAVWLLNLEDLDLAITGDPTYSQDLARYIAAEIAVNPWSTAVRLDCVGLAAEIAPMNPGRVTNHTADEIDGVAADLFADAVAVVDRSIDLNLTVPTARAGQAGEDSWGARMLLTTAAAPDTPALHQLVDLVHQHPGHTGTAVVINGLGDVSCGVQLHVNEHGRLTLPSAGLDLVAVGLTSDEAQGCAALLAQTGDNPPDVPTPIDRSATDGWQSLVDQAGGLRPEHTLPRDMATSELDEPAASLLPDNDDAYLATGATTAEDLQALAPKVPVSVRTRVQDADPTLDEDVRLWFDPDCPLPRLSLIGPVTARTRGTPVTSRKPYWTEILAYLATRPHGATPDELAAAFTITPTKAREYARTVREWLGLNPRTGQRHLPNAREAPSAKLRGVGVYEVADVLVDMHLFFRLRVRGEAKGPAGIDDLRTALDLVGGRPFDQLRAQGWTWLLDGDRHDHQLICAIVDVAHLVITHDLHAGNLRGAQLAAETAILAAPDDEIARLGLASVAKAAGHHTEAERIVQDQICNRTDDDEPPPELPARSQQILSTDNWLTPGKAAG